MGREGGEKDGRLQGVKKRRRRRRKRRKEGRSI